MHCDKQGYSLLKIYQDYLNAEEQKIFKTLRISDPHLFEPGESMEYKYTLLEHKYVELKEYEILKPSLAVDISSFEMMQEVVKVENLLDLYRKINLVQILGVNTIENLYDAIFYVDPIDGSIYDYGAKPGAPDLFIWHPDPAYMCWFFAEVKGPRDHLRESQYQWIQKHWDCVQGRVILLTVL